MFRQAPAYACRLTQTDFRFAGVTPMPRGVCNSTVLVSGFVIFLGGGGGGGGGRTQPPPPQPGFTIGLSTSTVSIAQGNSSAPLTGTVNGLNRLFGSVPGTPFPGPAA